MVLFVENFGSRSAPDKWTDHHWIRIRIKWNADPKNLVVEVKDFARISVQSGLKRRKKCIIFPSLRAKLEMEMSSFMDSVFGVLACTLFLIQPKASQLSFRKWSFLILKQDRHLSHLVCVNIGIPPQEI
jgi:hypothetical protein